jgi:hypothetical protein
MSCGSSTSDDIQCTIKSSMQDLGKVGCLRRKIFNVEFMHFTAIGLTRQLQTSSHQFVQIQKSDNASPPHRKVHLRRHVQDSGVDVRWEDLIPFVLEEVSKIRTSIVPWEKKSLTQSISMSRSL